MFFKNLRSNIILLSLCLPSLLWAQNKSVIPYSGSLYSQGKPVSQNEAVNMAFALYAFNQGTTAETIATQFENQTQAPFSNLVWASWRDLYNDEGDFQAQTVDLDINTSIPVYVRNGQFLVHLGDSTQGDQPSLYDSIFSLYSEAVVDGQSVKTPKVLYLVIWVNSNGTAKRLPPQKLNTVPHAVTADQAVDFEVKGDLLVEGKTTLNGDVELRGRLSVSHAKRCPEEYALIGSSCISKTARGPLKWFSGRQACAQEGADLCSVSEMAYCDFADASVSITPNQEVIDSECVDLTDPDSDTPFEKFFTRSFISTLGENYNLYYASIYNNMPCYNGTNDSNANDLDRCRATNTLRFFCCMPALPVR